MIKNCQRLPTVPGLNGNLLPLVPGLIGNKLMS